MDGNRTRHRSSVQMSSPILRMDSFCVKRSETKYPRTEEPTSTIESVFDTFDSADAGMTEHINLIRNSTDWASTSMGAISTWPKELATTLYLVMLAPQPRSLLLGVENLLLYNQAYGKLVRGLHPKILGRPVSEVEEWKTLRDEMAFHRNIAQGSGRTQVVEDFIVPMMRNGRFEDVYMEFSITPLPSPLTGLYMCFDDKTECVVRERQRSTIRDLSETWSAATDLPTLWRTVLDTLSRRPHDFPFAAVYSRRSSPDATGIRYNVGENLQSYYYLEGSVGDFDDSTLPVRFLQSETSEDPSLRPLLQAISSKDNVLLQYFDGTLPEHWSKASLGRGTGEKCHEAIVIPSSLTRHQEVEALVVIGLPTRIPFDDAQQAHINQLQREFADVVGSIVATTEAAHRRRENARRHQQEKELLAKEISLRQKEAELATLQTKRVLDLIDRVDIGFFEYAATGELIQANECYYRLSGYPRDCAADTKFKFRDLVYPTDVDKVLSRWNAMLNGESTRFEFRYKNGTSTGQWVTAACMPVRGEDGQTKGIIGAITDINAQKRSEQDALDRAEALERDDERFRRFMDVAPVGCLIADVNKGVIFANETWFAISNHPQVPLEQIDWNSVLHEEDLEIAEEGWQAMLRGERVNYTLRLKKIWHDSENQPRGPAELMVTAIPECDEAGKVVRVLGFTIDISHLKFAERVQKLRMEEAVEAKRQQERFYDTVSHEIRNPLSAVVHCADSIADSLEEMTKIANILVTKIKDPSVEIKRLFELIQSSNESVDTVVTCSEHQRRLIHDILTMSKLDSNLLQINPLVTRANSLLEDIKKMFNIEAERVGVKLKLVVDESVESLAVEWVNLDPGRILQILINLVTNAIKFTKNEPGDREVKVIMGVSEERPLDLPVDFSLHVQESIYENPILEAQSDFYLWFTVTDSGRGMTFEEKSRIFSRFTQASPRTYTEYGGSGLGLFISRQLVELQGGEIGVASEGGKGSTFAFFVKTTPAPAPVGQSVIPRRPSWAIKADSTDDMNGEVQISVTEATEPGRPTSVLVCEDNLVNQRVLKKQLIKHGYEVHVASNGQEALDFLTSPTRQAQIDVILMDIEMPIMDGLTCCKKIRDLERYTSFHTKPNQNKTKVGKLTLRPKPTRATSFNSIVSLGGTDSNAENSVSNSDFQRIPIIAISANARPEQTKDAILAGMDDAITKPFRVVDLAPRIDQLTSWTKLCQRT